MRPGIHPAYEPIVFRDKAADVAFMNAAVRPFFDGLAGVRGR